MSSASVLCDTKNVLMCFSCSYNIPCRSSAIPMSILNEHNFTCSLGACCRMNHVLFCGVLAAHFLKLIMFTLDTYSFPQICFKCDKAQLLLFTVVYLVFTKL